MDYQPVSPIGGGDRQFAQVQIDLLRTSFPEKVGKLGAAKTHLSAIFVNLPATLPFGDDYFVRVCDTVPVAWRLQPICAVSPPLSIDGVSKYEE